MSKKILQILKMITEKMQGNSEYAEELMHTLNFEGEDLSDIGDELDNLEFSRYLDDEELDILKALLVYLLLQETPYGEEDIYSFVFGKGKKIVWN